MNWTNERIPKGGIFHYAKAKFSPETRDFINVLLKESKLSILQRQKVNYSLRSGEPLNTAKTLSKQPKILFRPGTSKRRSQSTIIQSGAYNREQFIPNHPQVDREKAKKHLQDFMAFGKDVVQTPRKPRIGSKKIVSEEPAENRFDQLVDEIRERKQWLQDMEELGEGLKYKSIIDQQIQSKLREMEKLQEK